jgi:hypothetical protein
VVVTRQGDAACQPDHRASPWEGAIKVGLLGTGFGIAHAHICHAHPQVSEVVVFGPTPAKLQAFAGVRAPRLGCALARTTSHAVGDHRSDASN